MSAATENLILLIYLGVVLLSLPVAIVLTRQRRRALQPPPLPVEPAPALEAPAPPRWISPEDPYFPPQAALITHYTPAAPLHGYWRRPDIWFALIMLVIMAVLLGPVFSGPQAMEGVDLQMTSGLFIGQLTFHAAVVGIVVVYLGVFRKLEPFKVFGFGNRGPLQTAGLAIACTVLTMFALGILGAALMPLMEQLNGGELKQQMIVEKGREITDPATRLWMFATLAIGAPIMEEIVFRGLLFSVAARFTHPVYAAVASGAFFAVIHNSLYALVPLTVLGSVLAWAYHKSRTLAVPILMHSIFNGLQFLLLFYGPAEFRQ